MPKIKKFRSSRQRQTSISKFLGNSVTTGKNADDSEIVKKARIRSSSRFEICPICRKHFPLHILVHHAEDCTGVPIFPNKVDECSKTQESILEPISGLSVYQNFISEEEQYKILNTIEDESSVNGPLWKKCTFNGSHLGKRWGVHCNLRERKVTPQEHELPQFFHDIIFPKLIYLNHMKGIIPNEANAIDYRKSMGHYLKSHVDNRQLSKEPIANLSLAGSCYMTFTPTDKGNQNIKPVKVLLEPGSLQILTGKARYNYTHGIEKIDLLSERRVSITMRESPLTSL